MLGCGREIELHWMSLARAYLPYFTRACAQLLQRLLQPTPRAHTAALFGPGEPEAIRPAALDDYRQARVVHRLPPVRRQTLSPADQNTGEALASRGRAHISGRVHGKGI